MGNVEKTIRTKLVSSCLVCGSYGRLKHSGLRDRLFDAPGKWDLFVCTNQKCLTMWMNPMPIEEDIHIAYDNYYTHDDVIVSEGAVQGMYARVKAGYMLARYGYRELDETIRGNIYLGMLAWIFPARRQRFEFAFRELRGIAKGRILELGCGAGGLLRLLDTWGWRPEGIDVDARAVENAVSKKLTAYVGDIFSRRYPDNSFDAIVSSHVLEHLFHPKDVLAECRRILRPGGRLIIATPNSRALGYLVFGKSWLALDPPRHLHIFSPQAIKQLMRDAGFSSIRVRTSVRSADEVHMASNAIRKYGRFDMRVPLRPRGLVFWQVTALIQFVFGLFVRSIGEEIVVSAEK